MKVALLRLRGLQGDPRELARRAKAAASAHGSTAQLVNPAAVVSERHAQSAAMHAERALREGRAGSDDLGLEFVRFLTGERQIRRALEVGGVRPGDAEAVLVVLGGETQKAGDDVVRALAAQAAPVLFDPRDEEPALERVALLDLER